MLGIKTTARKLKVTALLAPETFASLTVKDNAPARTMLTIDIDGRGYQADVSTKGIRKALRALADNGAENIVLMIQGSLASDGSTITDAGLSAQVKAKAPEQQAAA